MWTNVMPDALVMSVNLTEGISPAGSEPARANWMTTIQSKAIWKRAGIRNELMEKATKTESVVTTPTVSSSFSSTSRMGSDKISNIKTAAALSLLGILRQRRSRELLG